MYSTIEQQQIFEQAKSFLSVESTLPAIEQISQLQHIIRCADWRYYIANDPLLADAEYDQLFTKLKKIEAQFPELKTIDSPTQRVAYGISERLPTVAHLVPMLSLDNTYNATDLQEWAKRCEGLLPNEKIEYCVEPKYDGASISLIYENGILTRAATRGDGVQGEEITINVKQIKSIPLAAKLMQEGVAQIEIRGEVVIHKNTFAALNNERAKEGQAPLANPRNAASGSLRMLDPNEVAKRKLSAILYHISDYTLAENSTKPTALETHYDSLKWLYSLGFATPVKEMMCFETIEKVIEFCADFEKKRDDLPYEIDGLVIKINNLAQQEKTGMTAHHPRWAVAYKFKAKQATSKLLAVEFQVGRTGSITPVAKIEPVNIGGAMVSSVSLFNEDVVREKDIKIGDTVLVERAGDVIPYIVKPLAELRKGTESAIVFPSNCPVCHEMLEKPADEAVWRCINIDCPAQVAERMIHFCSKDAMDIRGMGESIVNKFFEQKIIKIIPDIYELNWAEVAKLEGFKEKSIANLKTAIESSKKQPLNRLIFGLGIRHVGETTAKNLARKVKDVREFYEWNEEMLIALEDVGPKVAASIVHFFGIHENKTMLEKLNSLGVNLKNENDQSIVGGLFEGKSFLFTGTLSQCKRSDAEAIVEAKGGNILSGVSSKLNYLVVGEDAGSKLEKAKKIGTVIIMNEAEFLGMVGAE